MWGKGGVVVHRFGLFLLFDGKQSEFSLLVHLFIQQMMAFILENTYIFL